MAEKCFVREGFIAKQMKNFETKNAETIFLELTIVKKEWCILFAYRPPSTVKEELFDEILVSLNKILGKYDNIILAGDLNMMSYDLVQILQKIIYLI